ncbi:hypothetical protein BM221_006705 [Beauveria bassiana]|uniref:Uncharacterized protein n=1 Tax=Beauveria bassiana TaxID=176275 RepID=A0A2N6NIC7_BEABA|nr:hypothetical protein BM221_006705 [Beauveria bassiana]
MHVQEAAPKARPDSFCGDGNLAESEKNKIGHIHDGHDQPHQAAQNYQPPRIRHVNAGRLVDALHLGLVLDVVASHAGPDSHVAAAAGKVNERQRGKGQDGAEDDLGGVEGGVEAFAANGGGDDERRRDADGAGDEAAHPGLDLPAQGALGDHLAGNGADDAGGDAREQEGEGKDGADGRGDALGEEGVDAKDVGVEGLGVLVERGAGDDEDGRVDKEGKGEERGAELDDGVLEAVFDGGLRGHVDNLVVAVLTGRRRRRRGQRRRRRGGNEPLLGVVLLQTRLHDAGPEKQRVRHDGGAEDTAGLVQRLRLDQLPRGHEAAKDVADARLVNHGELYAEADDDAEHEQADKELKQAQALHGAVGAVKDEDEHDVDNGEGDAGDERQARDQQVEGNGGANDLGEVGGDDGDFGQRVEQVVEPARAVRAAGRREVVARDGAELDGERLQENGKDVAEEHDEEQAILVRGAGGNVGGVVAGVDFGVR